jgi:hypothetical protein
LIASGEGGRVTAYGESRGWRLLIGGRRILRVGGGERRQGEQQNGASENRTSR